MSEEIQDILGEINDNLYALLIVNMRNYDLLMALLNEHNDESADIAHEAHINGKVVGPLPSLKFDEIE